MMPYVVCAGIAWRILLTIGRIILLIVKKIYIWQIIEEAGSSLGMVCKNVKLDIRDRKALDMIYIEVGNITGD